MSSDLALGRQPAEVVGDEPADGDEIVLGELQVEELLHLLDLDAAGNRVVAGRVLDDLGLLGVVLVLDLAHDLLDHVLHGHEPGDAAVLVDDDGHLLLGLLELLEQVGHLHGLGDEDDRPDEGLDGLALMLLIGVLDDVLGHDDAVDVVDPVLVDGDPRVFFPDDEVLEIVDGGVLPDADHA